MGLRRIEKLLILPEWQGLHEVGRDIKAEAVGFCMASSKQIRAVSSPHPLRTLPSCCNSAHQNEKCPSRPLVGCVPQEL